MQNCHDENTSDQKSYHKENYAQSGTTSTPGHRKDFYDSNNGYYCRKNSENGPERSKIRFRAALFADFDGGLEYLTDNGLGFGLDAGLQSDAGKYPGAESFKKYSSLWGLARGSCMPSPCHM